VIVKGKNNPTSIFEVFDGESELVQELKLKTSQYFQQGIENYRNQKFYLAQQEFENVLFANPEDQTATMYLQRVKQMILQSPPTNWNGVWRLTEK
jgi:adenylate cyclase